MKAVCLSVIALLLGVHLNFVLIVVFHDFSYNENGSMTAAFKKGAFSLWSVNHRLRYIFCKSFSVQEITKHLLSSLE